MKPTVKWSCISGGARAPVFESPTSGKAAEWSSMVGAPFLFLFFARFPLEGATFRDLCSPMGLIRLYEGINQLSTFRDQAIQNQKQGILTLISVVTFLRVAQKWGVGQDSRAFCHCCDLEEKCTCKACPVSLSGSPQIPLAIAHLCMAYLG